MDTAALESAYRDIQSRIHPDRHAHAGDAQRRASMQWTTRVNEAYGTLKSPVQRAKYVLELNGVDVASETNTQMPVEFLTRQLELREALAEAKETGALDRLRDEVAQEARALERGLADLIDARHDFAAAAGEVRKLMFLHKLGEEIERSYEEIE
jgi:molecular chaperone HscB